jgi:hypothetical protein
VNTSRQSRTSAVYLPLKSSLKRTFA